MGIRIFVSSVLAFALSCGSDDGSVPMTFGEACAEVDGCESPVVTVPGATEPIWRVLVVREPTGDVRIETIDEVEVPVAIGAPQGPQGGTHGLAALDASGTPLEVQRLRFPTTLEIGNHPPAQEELIEDLTAVETSIVGYLSALPEVETIAIVDAPGSIVDSVPAPDPGEVAGAMEALVQGPTGSACAHVMILEGGVDEIWFPRGLSETMTLEPLGLRQEAVVKSALGRLNATHCAGVSRIAFVSGFDSTRTGARVSSWRGGYAGDLIMINAELDVSGWTIDDISLVGAGRQAFLGYIIAHEAAHATNNLLDEDTDVRLDGEWAPTERALAADTIDRVRLRAGLANEWARMHDSFVSQGWTNEYGADISSIGSSDGLARAGFMSRYASTNNWEDIAEFAAWPVARDWYRSAEVPIEGLPVGEMPPPRAGDHGCIAMSDHTTEGVPQALAAVYAKLSFLRDVGMVTDDDFMNCVGDSIGLPHDTEGISIYEDGVLQRVFPDEVSAGIGTLDGRYVFTLTAAGGAEFGGETYPAELTLQLDLADGSVELEKVSWPRGLYAIDPLEPHEFRLRLDGAAAGNFDVTDGFVLVARATNDRIVGSVFVREAFRYMAPVPVPQTFDPPLQFRFLLMN